MHWLRSPGVSRPSLNSMRCQAPPTKSFLWIHCRGDEGVEGGNLLHIVQEPLWWPGALFQGKVRERKPTGAPDHRKARQAPMTKARHKHCLEEPHPWPKLVLGSEQNSWLKTQSLSQTFSEGNWVLTKLGRHKGLLPQITSLASLPLMLTHPYLVPSIGIQLGLYLEGMAEMWMSSLHYKPVASQAYFGVHDMFANTTILVAYTWMKGNVQVLLFVGLKSIFQDVSKKNPSYCTVQLVAL